MLTPFDTLLFEHPDFDQDDQNQASINLFERQDALEKLLRGEGFSDDFLDLLESQGEIDPIDYVDEVTENILYMIEHAPIRTPELAALGLVVVF